MWFLFFSGEYFATPEINCVINFFTFFYLLLNGKEFDRNLLNFFFALIFNADDFSSFKHVEMLVGIDLN